MPSNARQYDDDVVAATGGTSDATPARKYDDDVIAAAKPDASKPKRVGWAEENLLGPSEILGAGVANIPHGAAHAAVDLYRRVTGGDTDAPDPSIVRATQVPIGEGGRQLLGDIAQLPGVKQGVDLARSGDRALETASPTTHDIVHQAAGVAGDVANIAPVAAPVVKGSRMLGEAFGARTATGAPASATGVDATQAALNRSVAQSGTNMGAAAAAPDVSRASQPLRAAIQGMSGNGTKPLNLEAVQNHLKADEFGINLTAGQATGDGAQLSSEFNTRNKNPAFAERMAQTNQKLIDGLNGIKEDVAPAAAVDHEANAQTVIDAYKDKYAPIAADAKAKWEKFQAAAGGALPLETGDFTAQVGAALKKAGKTRYLPSEVAGDIKDIDDGEPFTIERWDNLKTNLAAAQRKAERAGDGNAGLAVSAARDAVENYQFPNLDPKLAAMNREARAATANKYAMLRADPAMDAAVNDGVPSTPDSRRLSPEAKGYMERYFLKGNKADLSNAQANLADNPDAKGAIAGSVVNELKKAAGIDPYRNDGNFSQAGYNTRFNELQPRIKYLMDPDSADKAFRLGDVARITQRQPTGYSFNNSGTSVVSQVAKRVASGAAALAEHSANAATSKLKLGTGVREEFENWRNDKWVSDSLKPGAGIDHVPK
jgi:hypothetical protein